jgi:hypothetical protein
MVSMEEMPRTRPRPNARVEMPERDMLPLGKTEGSRGLSGVVGVVGLYGLAFGGGGIGVVVL